MVPLIKQAFEKVSQLDWRRCCEHVIAIESKYWTSDIAKDAEVDRVVFAVCSICSSDEGTDTGSDMEDYSDTDTAIEISDTASESY